MNIPLQIYRGDDKNYNFTFKNAAGEVIDITGWTIFFTVKPAIDDEDDDANAVIAKTITEHVNPANGIATVPLADTDSNDLHAEEYVYDFQRKSSAGKIKTLMHGPYEITRDVTRRIS